MKDREISKKNAKELVAQMTVLEKASQLKYDAAVVKRLGIPGYNWWNEALHGVARAGTATVFPQAIGMAAMFDEDMMEKIGDVIATEGRAKYNTLSKEGDRDIYKGLTYWSPNVNIFRDPRWGRGQETYGEDPYLSSRLGVAFVNGIQGEGEVLKAAACAKHFAVHSGPESIRHEFDAIATKKDMEETYLPAFEALVKEAKVEAVMGAYNRTNGEPCCGSKTLLHDLLREKWGFDGHVVSDCWALLDFHERHKVTENIKESAAMALKAGCDINCGVTYLHVMKAYEDGLVTEDDITKAAERAMTTRYRLGLFEGSEFDAIPYEKIECKEHVDLAIDVARKSAVLLKNDGILPLEKNKLKTIGVIGPNADSRVPLYGNYHGTSSRNITILEGIQDEAGEDIRVLYSEGSHLFKDKVEVLAWRQDRISEAVAVARHSEVVVLVLGLDETLEGEEMDTSNSMDSGDKKDLELPEVQRELLEAVTAVGKPTILVLMSGSAINLSYADMHTNAILQAWYPGARGGKAIADLLFGKASPSGKLPITFYRSLDGMPDFTDYTMKNRTYRYIEGEALYPFGYGLTYGNAAVINAEVIGKLVKGQDILVEALIQNDSKVDIEDIIQVYIKDLESKNAVRNHSLCAFKRVSLKAGEEKQVRLCIPAKMFTAVNEEGERHIESNQFKLSVGFSQPDARSIELTKNKPIEVQFNLE